MNDLEEVAESIFDEYGTTPQTAPQMEEPARGGDVSIIIRAEGGVDLFMHKDPAFGPMEEAEMKAMAVYAAAIRLVATDRGTMVALMEQLMKSDRMKSSALSH